METTVMHKFNQPGVFKVGVECSTSEWHVTADSIITIQEPVGEFGVIRCFSGNTSTDGTKCNALSGEPASIQIVVERGEPVTHNRGYCLRDILYFCMIMPFPLFQEQMFPMQFTMATIWLSTPLWTEGLHPTTWHWMSVWLGSWDPAATTWPWVLLTGWVPTQCPLVWNCAFWSLWKAWRPQWRGQRMVIARTWLTWSSACLWRGEPLQSCSSLWPEEATRCQRTETCSMAAHKLLRSPAHLKVWPGSSCALMKCESQLLWVVDLNLARCDKGLFKVTVRAINSISASNVDVDLKNILQVCQNYSDLSLEEEANTVCRK